MLFATVSWFENTATREKDSKGSGNLFLYKPRPPGDMGNPLVGFLVNATLARYTPPLFVSPPIIDDLYFEDDRDGGMWRKNKNVLNRLVILRRMRPHTFQN